ncbi:TonB-dependent receptor [Coprobacter secundus]|uniref:SusC/RagA family TonB-linked outer membrane protein n=1 Tax=Coprobacter secundus subsp. similis TaxID=2751153 RepID=A0A7G1HTM5_9BACT|nr:TonB-dependent receptor [Coprobacter secundus]BCI62986.1 SusC/RagA family TonB-linked outer membrane protein [Coprobacter secundus subsp. similis]
MKYFKSIWKPALLRTALLLFILNGSILNVIAQEPKLSINLNKVTIKQFFNEIQRKTDYTFSYREGILNNNKDVSISVHNKNLSEILKSVLDSKGLSFSIQAKSIVITQQLQTSTQSFTLKGKVTNSEGEPLIGVTVLAKNSKNGTATDFDGNFSIRINDKNTSLQFTYVGYKQENVQIKNHKFITVIMEEDSHMLNEVVAVGYGVMRKSDLTGSVVRVGSKDISNIPTVRLDQALTGKASGVHITNTSGEPGAGTNILIRGGNSISASNEPLYVIDGFIGAGDLNLIDPNDIESVEILKDAAATSIYGARGANGVVIVTTKRGTEGRNNVTVNTYIGVQHIAKRLEMINAREYAEMLNQQDVSVNQEPSIENPSIYGKGTDWQNEILRMALMQNYQIAASGGNKDSRYYLSISMFDQEGVIKNSGIRRYQTRLNLDRKIGKNINIGANFQFSYSQRKPNLVSLGGFDYQSSALATPPTMGIYNEDGSYAADSPSRVVSNKIDNVVAQLNERKKQEKAASVYAGIFADWEAIKGLKFKTFLGLNASNNKTSEYKPSSLPTMIQNKVKGEAWINQGDSYSILWENTVNYMKEIAKSHHLTVLGGYTLQTSRSEGLSLYGKNFTNDLLDWNNLSDAETKTRLIGSSASEWAIISYLGRINYSVLDRYLVTVTGRYDGSSRLGKDNRFAFFPSVAVAWRLSEEKFMKRFSKLDNLKIRASYGLSGNQDIALYQTLPLMKQQNVILTDIPQVGYIPDRLGNDKLKWETTAQFDFGIEASFFKSRLNIEFDTYTKRTRDLLLDVEFPYTSGFKNGFMNVGKISNRGVELMIRSTNIVTKDFSWTTEFNIARNKNKVVALGPDKDFEYTFRPGLGTHPYSWLKVGQPVGAFYGYIMDGIYRTREQIEAGNEPNASLGQKIYRDINGDGVITIEDQTTIGDPNPDFFGGLNNTFTYKNFTLNVFLQGTYGNDILSGGDFLYATVDPRFVNQYKRVKNFWSLDNPNAEYPKLYSNDEYQPSTYMIHNGSHLKIKSVSLYYNLPVKKWKRNKVISEFQCYITGTNLFTFTSYKGYDPEVNTGTEGGYKVYSANVLRGMDFTAYPSARTFTFGIKLTL